MGLPELVWLPLDTERLNHIAAENTTPEHSLCSMRFSTGDNDEQGMWGSIPSYLVSSVFGSVLVPARLSVLKPWPGEERTAVEGAPSLLSQKVRFPMKCSSLFHVEKTNASCGGVQGAVLYHGYTLGTWKMTCQFPSVLLFSYLLGPLFCR